MDRDWKAARATLAELVGEFTTRDVLEMIADHLYESAEEYHRQGRDARQGLLIWQAQAVDTAIQALAR